MYSIILVIIRFLPNISEECTSEHGMADMNNMNRVPAWERSSENWTETRVNTCGSRKQNLQANKALAGLGRKAMQYLEILRQNVGILPKRFLGNESVDYFSRLKRLTGSSDSTKSINDFRPH